MKRSKSTRKKKHLMRHNPLTPGGCWFSQSTPCSPFDHSNRCSSRVSISNNAACPPTVFVKTAPEVCGATEPGGDPLPCSRAAAKPRKPALNPRQEPQRMEVRSCSFALKLAVNATSGENARLPATFLLQVFLMNMSKKRRLLKLLATMS